MHLLGEPVRGEGVVRPRHDEHRDVHLGEVIERAVLARVLQHSEEEPWIDPGEVHEVRREVLAPHHLPVHLQVRGELVRPFAPDDQPPEQMRGFRPLLRSAEQGREDVLQHPGIVEGVEGQAVAAADQHHPQDALRVAAVVLERYLHAHRVAEQDGLAGTGPVEHRGQVVAEIVERDARPVGREPAAAVAAVVPAEDAVPRGEVAHQVLPGEAVAADAVAADQRGGALAGRGPVDARAVLSLRVTFVGVGRELFGHGAPKVAQNRRL